MRRTSFYYLTNKSALFRIKFSTELVIVLVLLFLLLKLHRVSFCLQMMYRFSPKRSELFGTGADLEDNMQALEEFVKPLEGNLKQVHDFYTLHNLHCLKKV